MSNKFSEIKIDQYDCETLDSPFSRIYLRPKMELIIHCAMRFKHPIDVEAFKSAFSNSIMLKHPRFCSLIVRNPIGGGGEQWKRTHVSIDDHFILHHPKLKTPTDGLCDDDEAVVNAYLAEMAVSTPLSEKKPLWEVHVLVGLKCVVLRVHHSVGDGVSLMSMLSACFGKNGDGKIDVVNGAQDRKGDANIKRKNEWEKRGIWELIKSICLTIVFSVTFIARLLWVKDKASLLSGGDGVELWPRKCATAKFKIEDFNSIRKIIPNATINDVLLGVISYGLSRYLDFQATKALQKNHQVTGIVIVNLRGNPSLEIQAMSDLNKHGSHSGRLSSWGNKTGILLLPIDGCNGFDSLGHIKTMKAIMDLKKLSYESHLSYLGLKLVETLFGPKVASWFCYNLLCNTTLLISNIMGPSKKISIANNPATSMKVNISGQPHAITLHMVSYDGHIDLQVMVAKNIIPDPELLAKCFEDSLVDMKQYINIK